MLKICIYYPHLFNRGGCETVIKSVILTLHKEICFHILTSLEEERKNDPEYKEFLNYAREIVHVPPGNQKILLSELNRIKPQVVFTSFFHFATSPCRKLDIPLVEFCVGARIMPRPQGNPLHNYLSVESLGAKRMIMKSRPIEEQRIRVIRNAVSYDENIANKEEIRKIFCVPEDFFIISLNARAVSGKGWFITGDAMRELCDEHVMFIGFSRIEKIKGKVWEKIQNYYNKQGNFMVLDGAGVDRKYVLGVTAASDLVCLPTTHKEEGIPNCIVEALYFGKPVITCRNGYLDEIIFDGKNGIFVSPNSSSVAKGVKLLMNDREMREKLSSGARKVYERLYDREIFKNSYRQIFEDASKDGHFYGNMLPSRPWKWLWEYL